MRTRQWGVLVLSCLLLTACGPAFARSDRLPSNYVTPHPNPSLTPTPFRPSGAIAFFATLTPTPFQPDDAQPEVVELPVFNAVPFLPDRDALPDLPQFEDAPPPFPLLSSPDSVTFILLGSDRRGSGSFRTDTIVVVILRPGNSQVTLISIPRDFYVYIPTVGMNRINTAYQFGESRRYPGGGPALLRDTVLYNLGILIDHTAMVDFNGFIRIVDTLGGIDVPIACGYTDWRLKHPDLNQNIEDNWELYTAGPGLVHMDGDFALWYSRARKRSSDIDRGRRQQEVLRAIYGRILSTGTIARLPQLYADLGSSIVTDLSLEDLLRLSPLAFSLHNADIRSFYIRAPMVTAWTTPNGAYVLLPEREALLDMLEEATSPSSRPNDVQALEIEIQNGTPNKGWEALASTRLNYAGYRTRILPAEREDVVRTILFDSTSDQDPQRAAPILSALGLSAEHRMGVAGSPASYRLVIGGDYRPCFNPHGLAP